MAMITRYEFTKKLYPERLVIIKTNKNKLGYTSLGVDKVIIDKISKVIRGLNYKQGYNYLCFNMSKISLLKLIIRQIMSFLLVNINLIGGCL